MKKPISLIAALILTAGLTACDKLPNVMAATPGSAATPAPSAANASSSIWRGTSTKGTSSIVTQTSTGENVYSFSELWTLTDGSKVETKGTGKYDPATKTNVYTYTSPKAAVVKVTTEEQDSGTTTIDTVLESNSDLFSVGDKITYKLQK